jgi:hypothetical protein
VTGCEEGVGVKSKGRKMCSLLVSSSLTIASSIDTVPGNSIDPIYSTQESASYDCNTISEREEQSFPIGERVGG